jgi:hypothetical protein
MKKFNQTLLFTSLILMVFFQLTCSPSIGRRIIPKKTFETETSASVIIGDADAGIGAVPTLDFAMRYGLTDRVTIGTTWHPLALALDGSIFIEPFGVFNVVNQNSFIPSVNTYIGLPIVFFAPKMGLTVFPLVGICPNYQYDRWKWYGSYEASFDSKPFDNGIDVHSTVKIGGSCIVKHREIFLEIGLQNIGHESWINNSHIGLPTISLGYNSNITLLRKKND